MKQPLYELTAAGLFGTFTRFPFHSFYRCWIIAKQNMANIESFNDIQKKEAIFLSFVKE